ncbi:glycosyltransferase family 2 protein [Candidatus Parcubacteria bacterium]|nr:MAG: glycosyltransferase family 2 protein [Candidatus Parcubacteria bacterium]
MKIDIIIPNYNGLRLVEKNLPLVIDRVKDFNGVSIVIVDDCSSRDEFEKIKELITSLSDIDPKTKIELIRNEKNLGFSSSINKAALKSNADYLVFLNTDVIPEKDFLKAAIEDMMEDNNLFGIGFLDKSIEGEKTILRGRGVGAWKRGFLIHKRGEVDRDNTLWISGGSCLVNAKVFKKLGGFDNIYNPFYWEDIDLSYRAQKAGFNILFEKRSEVVHKHFEGAIKKYYSGFQIKTYAYRNQFIFIWKNITDLSLVLSHILWLPYHLLRALIRLDTPFFLGFVLALVKIPVIIFKRIREAKNTKTDKQVLQKFK